MIYVETCDLLANVLCTSLDVRKINASRKQTYQESVDVVQYNRFIVTECNTPAHCIMLN